MLATSPPAIAPTISTAPIETNQRMSCPPQSYQDMVTRKSRAAKQEHDLLFTSRLDEIRNVYRGTIARPHSAPKQPHRSMQLVIAAARSAGVSASIASRRLSS